MGEVYEGRVAVGPARLPRRWRRVRRVPRRAVRELPFRVGWGQASSAHMWEHGNRPVRIAGREPVRAPAARSAAGFVQVRYYPMPGAPGQVLAWSTAPLPEIVEVARVLAAGPPVTGLLLTAPESERDALAGVCDAPPTCEPGLGVWERWLE